MEVATVHAILALLENAIENTTFEEGESPLAAALDCMTKGTIYGHITLDSTPPDPLRLDGMTKVKQEDLKTGMMAWTEKLSTDDILTRRTAAKGTLAAKWNDGTQWLRTLSRNTHFKQQELVELQKVFQEKCNGEQGRPHAPLPCRLGSNARSSFSLSCGLP